MLNAPLANEKAALAGGFLGDSCNTTAFYYPKPESVRGRILGAHLRGEKLTPQDSLRRFSDLRLAANENELRNGGWPIKTEMIEVDTRDAGRRSKVARYYLPPEAIAAAGEEGQRYAAATLAAEIERRAA